MKQYKNIAGKFFTSFFVAAICAATVACAQDDSNGTSRFAGIWMMDEVVESQKTDPDIETINVYRIKDDGSIVRLGIEKRDNMQWGQVNSQGRVKLNDDIVKMIESKGGKLPERIDFRLRNDGKLEMLDGDSTNGTPHILINEVELAELRAEFKQLRVASNDLYQQLSSVSAWRLVELREGNPKREDGLSVISAEALPEQEGSEEMGFYKVLKLLEFPAKGEVVINESLSATYSSNGESFAISNYVDQKNMYSVGYVKEISAERLVIDFGNNEHDFVKEYIFKPIAE